MAISVDSVYKKVLTILNKESRGFMGPDEFQKLGSQVQLDLLDRNFHDYNRAIAKQTGGATGQGYANIPKKIQERIDPFYTSVNITLDPNSIGDLPSYYYIINVSSCNRLTDIERVEKSKLNFLLSSPLTTPSSTFPIYYLSGTREVDDNDSATLNPIYNTITILPNIFYAVKKEIVIDYIKVPNDPIWAHIKVDNSGGVSFFQGEPSSTASFVYPRQEIADANGSFEARAVDFELHPSQEVDLVLGILRYAGVVIRDPSILQPTQQETSQKIQLEN